MRNILTSSCQNTTLKLGMKNITILYHTRSAHLGYINVTNLLLYFLFHRKI